MATWAISPSPGPSPGPHGHAPRFKVTYSPLCISTNRERGAAMPDYTLRTWIARRIQVRQRLERVCTGYLLFLMVVTTKHILEEAARFSGLHKSQFSKVLKFHPNIAAQTLESLSKQQAKGLSKWVSVSNCRIDDGSQVQIRLL